MLDQVLPNLVRCRIALVCVELQKVCLGEATIEVGVIYGEQFVDALVFLEVMELLRDLVAQLSDCMLQKFHTHLLGHVPRFAVVLVIDKVVSRK